MMSIQRSRLWAMSYRDSRALRRLAVWSTKNVLPPRLSMPASNVRRVRSEGFSKNITICLPARVPRKSAGRCLSMEVRLKSESISAGARSWTETRSRGATGSGSRFGGFIFVGVGGFISVMGSVLICVSYHSISGKFLGQLANTSSKRLRFLLVGGDDQHGIVPGDGADHLRPMRGIECGRDGLRAADRGLHHEQVLGLPDFDHKLVREMHHRRQNAFRAQAFARPPIPLRALDEFQFVDVAGEGSLADVVALALKPLLQRVLAFDRSVVKQVEDRLVARCFRHE